jgi:hypothetical protein
MSNAKSFKMVFIGARNLRKLFKVQSAEARHFGIALLEPFRYTTKIDKGLWAAFLELFLKVVPFDMSDLRVDGDKAKPLTERHAFNFYFATRGAPGELAKFLETTAICAFERNHGVLPDRLLVDDFVQAFEFLWRNDARMQGTNPFSIADQRDVPSMTPSNQSAADDGQRKAKPRAAVAGGRIHGR